jgi:hypothetical protein
MRHHPEPRAIFVAPPVRHRSRLRQLEVEHDGEVHEYDVPVGDRKVVHHRRARHIDGLRLNEPAARIRAMVDEERPHVGVVEEMELAGRGGDLRVSRHAGRELPAKVVTAASLELSRHFHGQGCFNQREHPPGMGDDVRVRQTDRDIPVPSDDVSGASSRNARVLTHRFRYQTARPSRNSTPWSIPSPKNQCGDCPVFGLGPLRTYKPRGACGTTPFTGRSNAVC